MIITVSGSSYTINNPEYGYESIIGLALIHTEVMPRGWEVWDNGDDKDFRTCRTVCILNATDTKTLRGIFSETAKGRGINFTLSLGTTSSGFFPFGPDYGDKGDFICRMMTVTAKPVLEEPWIHFRTELEFVLITAPAYSLLSQVSEGDLHIGTIQNLRYPPNMPESHFRYTINTQLTYDGTPYTVDKTSDPDFAGTKLQMVCNQSKAAALINHLVDDVRASQVNIIAQANNYIFGNISGDATYGTTWLDEAIVVTHNRFDEFEFQLNFYRKSES